MGQPENPYSTCAEAEKRGEGRRKIYLSGRFKYPNTLICFYNGGNPRPLKPDGASFISPKGPKPITNSMKYFIFILLSFTICANLSFAQTSSFTITTLHQGLDSDQNKVLTYVNNLPRNGSLMYINWTTQGLVDANGDIIVTLPDENNGLPITFNIIDADYSSTTEYALFGRSALGNIALYVTPQGTGGTIDLITSSYSLYPLGGTKGLLIKESPTGLEPGSCGTDTSSPGGGNEDGFCEDDCGKAVLDVLAMVTPAAQTWVNDNFGIFGQWFLFVETNNINGAFVNSAVSNKRVRVRIINYTPNFALTDNIFVDSDQLSANTHAQQTVQINGADVGILLTKQDYGTIFGVTNSLDPLSTNKFCIAQVEFISSIRYTFAHELAHQFGCLHSNPLTTGCPHGKNMLNGRNTIVANQAPNHTRIQHFSNPDISFGGEATGTAGSRNNAAQIRGAFCEAANNNTPVFFAANFDTDPVVCEGYPFSAYANGVEGWGITSGFWEQWCTGPYTYQWSWSNNPNFSTPHNVGTNSPVLELPEPPVCPLFYLRVTVTSAAGCTASYTRAVHCQPEPCDRSAKGGVGANFAYNQIIPNPANDQIRVLLADTGEIKNISVINAAGTTHQITQYSILNQGEITCSISTLQTGLWFLRVHGSEKSLTLKFTIVR